MSVIEIGLVDEDGRGRRRGFDAPDELLDGSPAVCRTGGVVRVADVDQAGTVRGVGHRGEIELHAAIDRDRLHRHVHPLRHVLRRRVGGRGGHQVAIGGAERADGTFEGMGPGARAGNDLEVRLD